MTENFYSSKYASCDKPMGFVGRWLSADADVEAMLWQCFNCKSIAVTYADETKEDKKLRKSKK